MGQQPEDPHRRLSWEEGGADHGAGVGSRGSHFREREREREGGVGKTRVGI